MSTRRTKSFTALTDSPPDCQSGSTLKLGRPPSPMRQKIQNRFHSLYDGTWAYSHFNPSDTSS